jgi:hypothetical protein
MALLVGSLAVTSALHLSGAVQGRNNQVFSPFGAGVAEAVIGVVLACGAVSLARAGRAGRGVALGATAHSRRDIRAHPAHRRLACQRQPAVAAESAGRRDPARYRAGVVIAGDVDRL